MKKYAYYILCVVTGILLVVGLRSASAAPTVTPPSGNVNPNFNQVTVADTLHSKTANVSGDLTVLGSANLAGNIYAIGNIENSNGSVVINDDLVVKNGVNIQGALEVADVVASGDIDMGGDLQVSKTIEASGELRAKGGIVNPGGDVKINDGLDVQGTIKNSNGEISIIDFDGIKINGPTTLLKGPLDLQGIDIINTAKQPAAAGGGDQPVYIKDSLHLIGGNPSNLSVTGNIGTIDLFASGKASFQGDTEIKNAYITGSLQNSAGTGDYIKVDDMLDVRKGIFNNDGTKLIKFGGGSSPMDLSVTGKATVKALDIATGGTINYDGTNIMKFTKGSLANGVEILGNLKAKNIGAYGSSTAKKSLVGGKTDSVVTYCSDSNYKLLSCSFWTPGKLTIGALERIKTTNADKTETYGCSLAAYNPTGIAYDMSVTAFCYNSNSF